MISKISSDMYPVSELRKIFVHRIRTTGFFNTDPDIIVSFKLFTNIVAKLSSKASSQYGEIIETALSSISFNTIESLHRLSEVNYMFNDESNRCVVVLNNGKDLLLLKNDRDARPIVKSPKDFTISTILMKRYYLEHISDYWYLNKLTEIVDSKIDKRSQLTNDMSRISNIISDNEWVKDNIMNCLEDLKKLVSNSAFVIV